MTYMPTLMRPPCQHQVLQPHEAVQSTSVVCSISGAPRSAIEVWLLVCHIELMEEWVPCLQHYTLHQGSLAASSAAS